MCIFKHDYKEVWRGTRTFYFVNDNLEDDQEEAEAIVYHCVDCGKRKVVRI